MIKRQGDLFTTDAKIIGHGVNCSGVMGAGIAATFKTKFPRNYEWYKEGCDKYLIKPGRSYTFVDKSIAIANIASQNRPGPDAQYDWLFSGLYSATQDALRIKSTHGSIIAIPQIGCGIGGLEWAGVEKIIEAVETCVPTVEFEVWEYKPESK